MKGFSFSFLSPNLKRLGSSIGKLTLVCNTCDCGCDDLKLQAHRS
ncbi:hypothetical protein AAZX31_04G117300 [Glycine max]